MPIGQRDFWSGIRLIDNARADANSKESVRVTWPMRTCLFFALATKSCQRTGFNFVSAY